MKKPTVLMILDGYGLNDRKEGNAIALANTPVMDKLMAEYPFVRGNASGMAVGLPEGQMGNSEVGHLNMGAGRIVYQELTRITKEIQDGTFFENPALLKENQKLQYVNGSRFSKQSDTKGRKWYRKITSMGLVFLLKFFFHMKATDAVCGFTFLRKEAAEQLLKVCSDDNGWFYTIEFLLRAERMGMVIYDMPVEWQEDYNTTVKVFKTIWNYLIQMRKLKKAFRQEEKENVKKN